MWRYPEPRYPDSINVITGSVARDAGLSNLPVHVYDGTRLLQLDKDYMLSDYKIVKASSAQVTVSAAQNSNYTGAVTAKLTVYESGAKIINPENVKLKIRKWKKQLIIVSIKSIIFV